MGWIVLGIVAGGLALVLAVVLIPFNLKRIHVIRAAAQATDQQLDSIYRLIEASGTETPVGCVLVRINQKIEETNGIIAMPEWLEGFPWAGRAIAIVVGQDVEFTFVQAAPTTIQLLGKAYRAVAVPRVKSKSGKFKNVFAPARLLSSCNALLPCLREVCPKHPEELLGYLLAAGAETFEFDPINQARVGTSPSWVQDAELHSCDVCNKRMTLILQLPGTLAAKKGFCSAVFYLFGCPQHPDRTKIVSQYS